MKRLAGPEAAGPEVGAVSVAGQDEQAGAVGGGHDTTQASGGQRPQSLFAKIPSSVRGARAGDRSTGHP
jgi:hypothetical protein